MTRLLAPLLLSALALGCSASPACDADAGPDAGSCTSGTGGGTGSGGPWHADYVLVSAAGSVTLTNVAETSGSCTGNTSSSSFSVRLGAGQAGKSAGVVQWLPLDVSNPLQPSGYVGLASFNAGVEEFAHALNGMKVCPPSAAEVCPSTAPATVPSGLALGNVDLDAGTYLPAFTVDQLSAPVKLTLLAGLPVQTCYGKLQKLGPAPVLDPLTLGDLLKDGDLPLHLLQTVPVAQTDVTAGTMTFDLTLVVKKTNSTRP